MDKYKLLVITLFVLLFSVGSVMAENTNDIDVNQTDDDMSIDLNQDNYNHDLLKSASEDTVVGETSDEIVVENWAELQYYSSLNDKNYVLKLKENTNYYPMDPSDSSNQILFNNNVTIIGASGAYIGDTSPNPGNITYTAMLVPDNNGVGITVRNVLFKWIGTRYQPDGVFLQMGGNSINYFENCYFTNISTNLGHSSILHIKTGDAIVTNCTFINCTTDFGCLSVYNPKDDPTKTCVLARMNVTDSYFEGNYARTEPGCINNCGILVVNNSTFYKNSAFWWAGAIHTHGGANTTIYDSDFIDNLAGWNGGALYTYSYLQIYNTRFIGNNCTTNNGGGAIGACKYLHAPYIHIEDSLFENNENLCWGLDELSTSGTGRGGAISLMDEGGLEVYNTTFIKNSASIGTAICAINGGLSYGSPDIRIIGNRFINHTRVGDVLVVRLATGSVAEIRDNFFENNSIEFSKLKLSADDPDSSGRVTLHIDAALKNSNSYDSDILDKSDYDVYVNGVYNKTVSSRTFTLDIERAKVYVVPCISNSKSNEVIAGTAKKYVYVSSDGDDINDGLNRTTPVKTLGKAIEIANSTGFGNIIIMNGEFKSDKDLVIDFNLTVIAENNASISSVSGHIFKITAGDVEFHNIIFKNCEYGSSSKNRIIEQTNTGFLILNNCVFENNKYYQLIESNGQVEAENLQFKGNNAILIRSDSIVIKSSNFIENIANSNARFDTLLKYKSKPVKFEAENLNFINNDVMKGCIDLNGPATITDCNFINNYMSATSSQRSSGIFVEKGSVLVQSCKFINSTDKGNYAAVIYNSGSLLVKDSIFLNNYYENSKGIFNGGTSGIKQITADYNWWGNTPDNLTKPNLYVTPPSSVNSGWDPVKYWLILNASSLSNEIEINKIVPVQFKFTQIDNEGNITNYDGVKLPSFDLELSAVNGTCPDSKITVENGMADTHFTLTQVSTSSLTGTFNGISTTINFQFKKSVPEMNISTNDILVGSAANIEVNLPSGATGSVTLRVGDFTQTNTVSNSKASFSVPNLPAGNYTIEANYSGNNIFESAIQTEDLAVNKHNSTTELSYGNLEVNTDAVFTITLSNGATGTVDMYVNGVKETTVNAGQTFTIPNIKRGDYVVRAVYSGDSYYLPSEDEITFDVGKFNATITVTAQDITYGADTIVNVNLNNDATGSITVTIDGKTNTTQLDNNGKATVSISGINAGTNKVIKVDYSGDNNYKNATATKTYNVGKANLDFTINAENIKLGQDALVTVQLPPRCGGTLTITGIKSETKNIPLTGLVTLTYSDLTVGTYTVSARYDGDNYQTVSKSKTFEVSDWNTPQWPNQGYDVKNTEKSPYSSEANGNVKWVKDIDGTIMGNMAIDSEGRIYIVATDGIYSINPNDGSTNWIFNSQDAGNNFSGIAIGRDVILAPKSGDKLYFINQTTGEQYHNNIYQGSSVFAPIIDENANVYISGEYYDFESTKVVVIPYKIWQTSTAPVSIEIGDYNITSSPVLVDDNTIILTTENRLMGIDVSSKSLILNIPVVCDSNPVVGLGNIVYIISNGHVMGYDVQGRNTHDIAITGTAGNYLSLGLNGEIFSINREGKLFEYSTGDEALIYDFKEPISSRLLVGQDEKLYIGSDSGMFYAIDVEGNLLWKVNLNQSVSASPAMDSNGVIYTISGNRIVAIDNAQPKDSKLTADIKNVTYGEDVIVNVDLDKEATGIISVKIGNAYSNESEVSDGKVSFRISDLTGGDYTAEITYSGDNRFSSKKINVKFTVGKIDPSMDVTVNNINAGEVLNISITNLPGDAKGTVSVSIGDKSDSANVDGSNAILNINGLAKGEYDFNVTYSGDSNYNQKTIPKHVAVGYVHTSFNATTNNVNVGQDVEILVTGLPDDANGVAYVTYNGVQYRDNVNKGSAKIIVPGLGNGTYNFDVVYANDTKYSADSQKVSIIVSKITPEFIVSLNNISVGDDLVVDVSGLPSDATGLVTVSVAGLSGNVSVANGVAKITIPQRLADGSYQVNVTYSGNNKYNEISQTKTVKISKITPEMVVDVDNEIYVGDDLTVDVSGLPSDAKGQINVEINGISNSSDVENGIASVIIPQRLANGNYTVTITYSGDDKYNSLKESKSVKISKKTPKMVVVVDNEINVGEDLIIEVSGLPTDTNVRYIEIVGDLTERGLINQGSSRIVISNITSGKYSFAVYFNGDDRYDMVKSDERVSVNKLSAKMKVIADNIDVGENLTVQIELPDDVTDEFVYISINDDEIPIKVNGGKAVYSISGLTKGTYNYTVSYGGNDKYEADEYSNDVEVGKIAIDYNAAIKDITYGESAVVSISNLPNGASGNVTVIINKKQYSSKISGSSISINIPGLNAGEQTAEVRYSDVNYMANSKYISFNVKKADPEITIEADDIQVGEDLKVIISLPNDVSGNVIVNVDEISKTVNLINGVANVNISGLSFGLKNINVDYNGIRDKNYNSVSASKSVTVSKINPTIAIEADDIKYGGNLIIKVSLPVDTSGNVLITVDEFSKAIPIKNGKASIDVSDLSAGNKTVNVRFDGDDKYYSASASKRITVSKTNTPITILADDIEYGENLVVKVNLNKDATGIVIISIGDISQRVKVANCSATATFSSLTSGDNVINVNYSGDENYNSCSASKNITVNNSASLITVTIDVKVVNNSCVDISIENVTGNIAVIVDGKEMTVPLDKGKTSIDLDNLSDGDHRVVVVYDGDDTYAPSHAVTSFSVPKGVSPISTEFREITVNDDLNISFVLKDINGNVIANAPISYTIDGITGKKTTDSKGSFAVASKDGAAITVNYAGDDAFEGTNIKFTFKGSDVPVVLNIASRFNIPNGVITINGYAVDVKAGEEGIYYSTELLDANGKPIKGVPINFAVNNKIYNRTTNDKGGFDPYKLNMIRAGRYTMAFYFGGNDNYTSSFACVCVDLDKKPITIKASAKTFKASVTKKYTVTLSTIVGSSHDGKVHLSPKDVSLTVNGKTYTGKTNADGKVTFNLKISKKGKYAANISFYGDATYDSATKSVKLTIK